MGGKIRAWNGVPLIDRIFVVSMDVQNPNTIKNIFNFMYGACI